MIPPPFPHQIVNTAHVIREPGYALFVAPRLGKSRIVVDAAHQLWRDGTINTLLVVAPAEARSIWTDPEPLIGEVAKWWPREGVQAPLLREYTAKLALPTVLVSGALYVLVTNPEMIRRDEHLERLLAWLPSRKTLLVCDESWMFQNPQAAQTKAIWKIAAACRRRVVLNGTPGSMDRQYSQYRIICPEPKGQPGIFGTRGFWQWRSHFCTMGGFQGREIVGYQNEARFHAATAPITTHLTKDQCRTPIPEVRTTVDVTLSPRTWKLYTEMERKAVAALSSTEAAVAKHAGAALLRCCQLTNGMVGGIESTLTLFDEDLSFVPEPLQIVSGEKVDALVANLRRRDPMPDKVVIFARFRADVERTVARLADAFPSHTVRPFYGDMKTDEKRAVKLLFAVGGDPTPAITVVNAQSGGAGLDLAAAKLCIFYGHDFSHRVRKQAEERIQGPHQTSVEYVDFLATGPKGEPTVDHTILAAQRGEAETERWTREQWRHALTTGRVVV